MPTKPLDQLSPAYRARLERNFAKGKTRQQARGHKVKEHVEREKKEKEKTGLTSSQKQQIKKFSQKQAHRSNKSAAQIEKTITDLVRNEYWKFAAIQKVQLHLEQMKRRNPNKSLREEWQRQTEMLADMLDDSELLYETYLLNYGLI
jgi:type III secretory pathway component EscV